MACAAALVEAEQPREVRKTVTVLFCDVAGSTALGERLDPESLRRVMARYFDIARAALERHGGTVEKFIGDAVMAVFGVPRVNEDDALRAVRAAAELREALAVLNAELERDYGVALEARIGVNTGQVVTGTEERLATGDAVNVAARLEQAAAPGEVLLGSDTYVLVRDAVEAEPAGPVPAKGKELPLEPYRLAAVREGAAGYARREDAPLVGRREELAQLRSAVERAERERACHLFTLLGPAGIGKSRLASELTRSLGERTLAVTGRCLSYGEGVAFWPLVEMARELGGDEGADLERALSSPAAAPEETYWAIRRTFEALAEERPLVVALDDFQWAEPPLLDLVEHVADLSRDAPIALVCLARPELLEARPGWGGGKLNATAMLLPPLDEAESRQLVDELADGTVLPEGMRERIVATAEGNPLFIEQMVAFVSESGDGSGPVATPPTIHALLAARLDRLGDDERAVLECASVVGKEFGLAELAALSPPGTELRRTLEALVRKELVRPHRDERFRFRSLLIRDAAYDGLSKQVRAELHARMGDWIDSEYAGRIEEVEEILGYHLAEAYRFRTELGPVDEESRALAERAAGHLAATGIRAYHRLDVSSAVGLLDHAVALAPEQSAELLPLLGTTLFEAGELSRARTVLERALEVAHGDPGIAARARCELLHLELQTNPGLSFADCRREIDDLVPPLEASGDDAGLTRAWQLVGLLNHASLRFQSMQEAHERALVHARRSGSHRDEATSLFWLGAAVTWGPTDVEQSIVFLEALLRDTAGNPLAGDFIKTSLAMTHGLSGRFEQARELQAELLHAFADRGMHLWVGGFSMGRAFVEFEAGDPKAAEGVLREGIRLLDEIGETSYLSTAAAMLAQALNDQGRYREALEQSRISEEATARGDVASESGWRIERARALARLGEHEEAERLAREGCAFFEEADSAVFHAPALLGLAEVLDLAGAHDESARLVEDAVGMLERKGATPAARRARARLG
jgi:class 3 adenylate cyclase/tetratricopeptide (TPR) repeat protein